jgi:O-phosphoseryl-tRNA(Cys) synthetase
MAENQRQVVTEIIDNFKSRLSKSVREQIGSAQFDDLAIMIDEAINTEIASAADMLENVTRKLRESARGPELGL